jgi:ribonuclease E
MRRMLINATQPEELRVALVDGQKLYDLDIEAVGREQKKSNIYMGKIMRVEPSLEAAFVDYGADRHGFLPLKEISRSLFKDKGRGSNGRVNIKEVIDEGQEIIVQVEKEERGNKGAALTTFISLAGRYLVAMPDNPRAGGVSRQIEGEDREEAKNAMAGVEIPSDMGLILRTAGIGKSSEELQWDLDYLVQLWDAIKQASTSAKPPFLIYQEQNVIIRAIRDYLRNDIAEILVDDEALHATAKKFMEQVMPHNLGKLKRYEDGVPLFTRYQIESQILSAFSREVRLPSGGSIVIEPTEALTTIDINSAKATQGSDIEETALKTNLEAADEVGTQLRLRDLGGLVVVDFIDMLNQKNQRAVENRLNESTKVDRARVQLGRISRFGLLEMSRQRIRPSLVEGSHELCPRCSGVGTIRGTRSTALAVIRILEEESMKDSTAKLMAQVPIDVATYLLNEKRQDISGIEERQQVKILLIPNQNLETPHYELERIREQDGERMKSTEDSIDLVQGSAPSDIEEWHDNTATSPQPLVKALDRGSPKPPAPKSEGGFFARIMSALVGSEPEPEKKPAQNRKPQRNSNQRRSNGKGSDSSRQNENQPRRSRGGQNKDSQRNKSSNEQRRGPKDKAANPEQKRTQKPSNRGGAKRNANRKPENRDNQQKSSDAQAVKSSPENDTASADVAAAATSLVAVTAVATENNASDVRKSSDAAAKGRSEAPSESLKGSPREPSREAEKATQSAETENPQQLTMAIDENPAKVTESASVTPQKSAPQNLAEIKNDLNESKSHETEERGGNSTEKVASSSSESVSNAAPAKGNEHIESEIEQAFAAYEDKDGNK